MKMKERKHTFRKEEKGRELTIVIIIIMNEINYLKR